MPRDILKLSPEVESALKKPLMSISLSQVAAAYNKLQSVIQKYYPSLWPQTHAYLSAIATLCFSDFPLPVTLIVTGPSGSGKTQPLMWLMRADSGIIERSDSFTPKSFVSHASNVKKKELEKIDLLPKLKDRCLCTKELAPLFAGREDELRASFAQLTTVLDGEGLVTSSGVHGTRGYHEPINFAWLGATVPPSEKVFGLMAALGTRLFFFSTDGARPSAKDYAAKIGCIHQGEEGNVECQKAVSVYLNTLIENIPIRTLTFNSIKISEVAQSYMGLLCDSLTKLRGGVSLGEGETVDSDRYGAPVIEHGWRAAQVLAALAKGSAIVRGSKKVELEDTNFIRHVCFSSMPERRRKVFEAILTIGGSVQASQVAAQSSMSKPTALHYLKVFRILGVVNGEMDNEPFIFTLSDDLRELLSKDGHTPSIHLTPNIEHNPKIFNTSALQEAPQIAVKQNGGVCLVNTKWDGETSEKYKETFLSVGGDEKYMPQPDLPEGF